MASEMHTLGKMLRRSRIEDLYTANVTSPLPAEVHTHEKHFLKQPRNSIQEKWRRRRNEEDLIRMSSRKAIWS
ncbi:hypothetical protein L596_003444 [Steinernema carpocapsae]|uniref:Uncharacterized protein n=1 Tax=Steinernema carpocapsae TaxID=34508 RepID=A0A4U8UU75_STECR|nr:hypothetical protein L596_003444 [Steinernema carpocapsae]